MIRIARLFSIVFLASVWCHAESASFVPSELFRIPFGASRETLASRIEGGNLLVPRDFTMDDAGRFYIYDTNNSRIARFSFEGRYEMGVRYPATARQVFAHADAQHNLWLLVGDPTRGIYQGVHDASGKTLREAIFSQYNRYRLRPDDDGLLHVLLSSDKDPKTEHSYILDQQTFLLKKEDIARPPETHHEVRTGGARYFIDAVPNPSKDPERAVNQIRNESSGKRVEIKGHVIYITRQGEIYTRVGDCEIDVYDVSGKQMGSVSLGGLASSCATVRFDVAGNIYQLDGVPDEDGRYGANLAGMRIVRWERR